MIEPIHSLAFSIQANRGVYAVLVGSGVSRGAKIPTGWEVTLDLIRKLARLYGEECEPDPEAWYRGKFKKEANYSDILDNLAKTPAERQQLLRGYWEPNDQDRENGDRQPTAAHRAIASLSAQGFIRVILTTNFDRLLETALKEEGVEPTVLSTPDQVTGAVPLIHTACSLFKVNGDYLDTRIRNTPTELTEYPSQFDSLLDRIFDEFGLVVCGWSAEWDVALRSALARAPSRRFTTYWALRGEPGDEAQRLIRHRGAEVISIEDADSFFEAVAQNVRSIEDFSMPHPLSKEAAVASLKRYLPDPRYRIQFADLVDKAVERIVEATSGEEFTVNGPTPDGKSVTARVRRYEAACSTLVAMATVGGFWAEEEHYPVWERAVQRLSSMKLSSGSSVWLALQRYPATLLLYAVGLGALAADRLSFLGRVFTASLYDANKEQVLAVGVLPVPCLVASGGNSMVALDGMAGHRTDLNDWVYNSLRPYAAPVIPDDDQYAMVFEKLEILIALSYSHYGPWRGRWAPPGKFMYGWARSRFIREIKESFSEEQDESRFAKAAIFGSTVKEGQQALTDMEKLLSTWGVL